MLPYAAQSPATAAQMGVTPPEPGIPLVLISDGTLFPANLKHAGLDDNWLRRRLKERGLSSCRQVFLLTVDEVGKVCLVPREKAG